MWLLKEEEILRFLHQKCGDGGFTNGESNAGTGAKHCVWQTAVKNMWSTNVCWYVKKPNKPMLI
jgi:hypothetical protein